MPHDPRPPSVPGRPRRAEPHPGLFRLLVEGVKDYAIFALDPQGYIVTWNEGAQRIKGYSREEITGHHFSIFYPPEDQAAEKPDRELEVACQEGRFEEEGWRVRKDGSLFWANVVITALYTEEGELVGFAKVTRDLTERRLAVERAIEDASLLAAQEAARRAAEERVQEMDALLAQLRSQAAELEARRREAEAANQAKSTFLATMSHELRTPLNAIGGYAELLEMGIRGPVNEAQRMDLSRIRRAQEHLLSLIGDVLDFAKLEAGRTDFRMEDVSVDALLGEASAMVLPLAGAQGVELRLRPGDPAVAVRADLDKARQIVLNLLSNAVKFTGPGGTVSVEWERGRGMVQVHVHDTGRGIPPDRLAAIFEPFVQVDDGLTRTVQGSGLGLAISRELARGMGGGLVVRSAEGRGSTFTLCLPLAPGRKRER